ncbi:hypothetical protein BH23VER1_BH23VER1_03260 [soil metagenome]
MNESTQLGDTSGRWQIFGYVLLFWLGYALLLVVSGALSGMVPQHWQKILLPSWQLIVFGPIMSLGAFILTVLLLRRESLSLEDVGVALRSRSPVRFVIGFLLGLILVASNFGIIALTTGMRLSWAPEASLAATMITLVSFCVGSCGEELGFRGYPLRRLERAYGLWGAQAIVAVAFAIYHVWVGWPWMSALVGTGVGSLLFGMAAIASRGLALPIGLHAAWGFGGWTMGGKGFWKAVSPEGPSSGGRISGSYLAVAGLGILAFWLWHQRNLKRGLVT